jgi:hypothetical protein
LVSIIIFIPIFKINLFSKNPKKIIEIISYYLINLISLSGIIANSANTVYKTKKYSLGVIKGICYIIFAYFIPNIFLEKIIVITKSKLLKFIIGLFFIYIMDLCINLIYCAFQNNIL